MTSYADDFTLLAFALSIVEAEARANQQCSSLVRWAEGKQLAIATHKSSMTRFISDIHQSRLHPHVRIGDAEAPLNRTPKILGITLDTHFNFGPLARDCVEQALNVMEALAESNWCFTIETLVATYRVIVHPILNYAAPIWFTQESSSHLDKLEVIHLMTVSGCHQKAAVFHAQSRDWGSPSEGALRTVLSAAPCRRPPTPTPQSPIRHLIASLHASSHRILWGLRIEGDDPNALPFIFGGVLEKGAYPFARRLLRERMIVEIVRFQALNKVLMATPPSNDPAEQLLPRSYRSALSQLRSALSQLLLEAPVLPPLSRLGRWPHLPRLPLSRPHGGPSL